MKLTVPWPHKSLNPNARVSFWELGRKKKAYSTGCGWEAVQAGLRNVKANSLAVKITFHPPDNRRRDRDNMVAAFKSGQDGIAKIIGVDDHYWVPTYLWGEPVKFGRVALEFEVIE